MVAIFVPPKVDEQYDNPGNERAGYYFSIIYPKSISPNKMLKAWNYAIPKTYVFLWRFSLI